MHLREPTERFVTEQRPGEMEPGHDHRTGVICHLPEELTAQPTGKGVNSQVLEVNHIVWSVSVLQYLVAGTSHHCIAVFLCL